MWAVCSAGPPGSGVSVWSPCSPLLPVSQLFPSCFTFWFLSVGTLMLEIQKWLLVDFSFGFCFLHFFLTCADVKEQIKSNYGLSALRQQSIVK